MKNVIILAAEHCLMSSVAGPMDIFLQTGRLWNGIVGIEPSPFFDVKIATLDGKPVMSSGNVKITPHCSVEEVKDVDLVLIPSQANQYKIRDEAFYQRVEWLKKCHKKGAELASLCTGAFTLAATRLLDGKTATTHWGVAKDFREEFPNVKLKTELMVTDEGNIYCGGGMTADFNLSMYLINKYCGREIALQCSRCTLIDLDRLSQSTFSVFLPEKNHKDPEVLKVQEYIEKNYTEKLSIELLSRDAGMSPRNLNRRFKTATGETVVRYIQLVRIEVAKKALESGNRSFDDISFHVGYENVSFFRRIFKRSTGLTPNSYQKKFFRYLID